MRCLWCVRFVLLTFVLGGVASVAAAAPLVQYEMFGEPGNQAFTAATFSAGQVTGANLVRGAGLTPSAGVNSMNSSGWVGPAVNDFYSFGFSVGPGAYAVVDTVLFATRSSNTGPGFVNVLYSVDGGPETLITTVTQTGTLFSNSLLVLGSPVAVTNTFQIILRSANNTAADGGAVGAAGTLRIGDFSPDNGTTFQPITIAGQVVPVPEPLSASLLGFGVLIVWAGSSRTRRTARGAELTTP